MSNIIKIHLETLDNTLQYLASKPYSEVFELIAELRKSAQYLNPPKEVPNEDSKDK